MVKVKNFFKIIACLAYTFLSSYVFPTLLIIAFNFSHGIANNPDGELLMPFGAVSILTILFIDFLIKRKTVISNDKTKAEKLFIILLFLFVKLIVSISIPRYVWNNFFHYLALKLSQ